MRREKLDRWADERKQLLERQIKGMNRVIREQRAAVRKAATLKDKVDKQRHIKILEGRRNDMRRPAQSERKNRVFSAKRQAV